METKRGGSKTRRRVTIPKALEGRRICIAPERVPDEWRIYDADSNEACSIEDLLEELVEAQPPVTAADLANLPKARVAQRDVKGFSVTAFFDPETGHGHYYATSTVTSDADFDNEVENAASATDVLLAGVELAREQNGGEF